jgi:hypothetical protein
MWFENSDHRSVVQTQVHIHALINWRWRPPPSSFHYILFFLAPAAISLFVTSRTMMMMMRATARLISINSYYREKLLVGWTYNTLHMFRLSFPCTYISVYTHVSDIKKRKRMCSLSFNGLVEMKKTKCLREITTIYYKWNILLVSCVLVDLLFRRLNIMSSYFFFSLCIHWFFDVPHIVLSSITSSLSSKKSEVHHLIIIEMVFSLYTSLYQKESISWLCMLIRNWRQKVCKESKRNI